MGSSKKVTVGYRYFVGAHKLLCRGPVDYVIEIQVQKRVAANGYFSGGTVNIDSPELFGGDSREGGIVGSVDIEQGRPTQSVNSYLETHQGVGTTPAYRRVLAAVLRQVEIGMNPYLKPWAFRVQRVYVRGNNVAQWYPSKAGILVSTGDPTTSDQPFELKWWQSSYHNDNKDHARMGILCKDEDGVQISETLAPMIGTTHHVWTERTLTGIVPAGTAQLIVVMEMERLQGANNDGYIDDITLTVAGNPVGILNPGAENGTNNWVSTIGSLGTRSGDPSPHSGLAYFFGGVNAYTRAESIVFKGLDMNPAHIIREAITDNDWGLGFQDSDIGSSFTTVADTLYDEGFGLSGSWEKQAEIEEFIQEIASHIDAYVYVDNETGLWEIKLIRDDYVVGNLPVLDDTNVIDVGNDLERIDPIEAVNSVTIRYTHHKNGDKSAVTVQDQALISEAGTIRSTSLDFDFIRWEKLAGRVAMRELLGLSSPILSGSLVIDRKADNLKPGEAFILNLPRFHINNEIMRVDNIMYDEKNSEKVTIKFLSDVFALADSTLVTSGGTTGGSYINLPQAVTRRLVEEAPYWSLAQAVGDTEAKSKTTTTPEIGFLYMAGESPTPDAINAKAMVDSGAGYLQTGVMDFSPAANLDGAVAANASVTSITIKNGSDLSDIVIGSLATISGTEMIRIDARVGNVLTVGRGCLDTPPQAHLDNAVIVFWGDDPGTSDETEYVDSESLDVKLLTVTGLGSLALASAPIDTVVMDSRAARPLPVGKLQLDGEYVPSAPLDDTNEVLTWVHRDRLTQTSSVIDDFTAASIGPEAGVDYTVLITWRDGAGAQVGTDLVNTSVGTLLTYTLTAGYMASRPVGATQLWFQVLTTRSGLREWSTPTIKATLP